ncbi:MAG TPA: YlbF family regulator [Actinomycetota bacterium]
MTQIRETVSPVVAEEPGWRSGVERAARDFGAALSETPEFKAFERAYVRFRDDERAQQALRAYQEEQRSLQPLLMLGAASAEQRAELERLRQAWMAEASVTEYVEAQTSLAMLSRTIDELLSERIGFGFAAACNPSCCG